MLGPIGTVMQQLHIGDFCITCNTKASLLNNGLLVVIIAIDPTMNDGTTPYEIRRIDGQPIPSSQDPETGDLSFFKVYETWTNRSKLRRFDPDGPELVRYAETAHTAVVR